MALLVRAFCALLLAPVFLWAVLAIWFDAPLASPVRAAFAAACGLGSLALLFALRRLLLALLASLVPVVLVVLWWTSIPPSNDREWMPDVARPPRAEIDGDRVVIHNVRNFHYRSETDFDEIWETREYDLSKLVAVDFFFSYWGSPLIAHTIASWQFEGAPPLAVSIETRKEVGESYSAVLGFFRQFELYYVFADERDVIQLRTNHRGEQVFLYRLRIPLERARTILLQYLQVANSLAEEPRWYNAFSHNCTTEIRHNVQHVSPDAPFDWRILVNGYLDQRAYERGTIDTSLPFEELRARSDITERAKAADERPDFSERIRVGLPGIPAG
jgi:hypothetical protein